MVDGFAINAKDDFSNKIWTFYCTNCDYDLCSKCAEKEKLI